eukprot:m.942762 g.942762  ORF g.942762 m.942762 type:complete len:509 (-) comp23838_c0_seq48:2416-3942(-)
MKSNSSSTGRGPLLLKLAISLAIVALDCIPPAVALWGGMGSDVTDVTLHKQIKKIKNSPYAWGIALYRDGCGYCELLKPEWTTAAQKMRKMVGVAAVDVVNHQHIAQALMEEYKFKVEGVPTIIILKPKASGAGKTMTVYQGERKSKAILKALEAAMPEYVARITAGALPGWQKRPGAHVVLFSKKREAPPQLKALSTKYRDRSVHVGMVDDSDTELRTLFGVNDYPKLFVIENGKEVGVNGYKPKEYKGSKNFVTMDFFVMDFAGPKPTSDSGDDISDSSGESDEPSKGGTKSSKATPTSAPTKAKKGKKEKADEGGAKKKLKKVETAAAKKRKEKEAAAKAAKKKLGGKLRKMVQPRNPITLKGTDLSALSVTQLRGILARYDDPCTGCIEKDNFLMKIAENRKLYGDMEHIARAGAAKKSKPKARTAKGAGMGAPQGMGAKSGDNDPGETADATPAENDDSLCARMLAIEAEPLHSRIEELEAEVVQLKKQLQFMQQDLIQHDDL